MTDDFLERTQRSAENWSGESLSPDQMVERFQLYGAAKRAADLDRFDAELRETEPSNLRNFARLHKLRRDLGATHQALRKAGR